MADNEQSMETDAGQSAPDEITSAVEGGAEASSETTTEMSVLTLAEDESVPEATSDPVKATVEAIQVEPAKAVAAVSALPKKAKPGPKRGSKMKVKSEKVVVVKPSAPTPSLKVAKVVKKPVPSVLSPKVASPKAASPRGDTKIAANKPVFAGLFTNFMLEETHMDMNTNFAGLQSAMTEAQAKAKAAFEKSASAFGEVTEFTKGNVEACVESSKILGEGLQGMGSELVSEGRASFEALTSDIKELAAAKSPTDFFKIQSDMVRKNFDSAVAYNSKNSEALLKLFSDSFAPLSGRMSLAMEKARSVSL